MTVQDFLATAVQQLSEVGIATARLDALVLLEDCLHKDRALLLAHPELELTDEQIAELTEHINQRSGHVPLAYIRGRTEFYGREFIVTKNVLEPRPESEIMIELLKSLTHSGNMTIVDVGTGSGALAITAKLELPDCDVVAIDIDSKCLKVAAQNATKHHADITFIEGDLVEPLTAEPPQHYALLCNLPYVPDSFQINTAALHEPRLAIFGGPDGLDLFRKMFKQVDNFTYKPQYILTESMPPDHEKLAIIARQHGYDLQESEDFIQVFVHSVTDQ